MTGLLHCCRWAPRDTILQNYHNNEGGVSVYDGRVLWKKFIRDGFQAELSWRTILLKRNDFKGFVPAHVAKYGEADVEHLIGNAVLFART